MPTSFPSGLDSFTTKVNGQVIQASHMNNVQDPIVAIETVVGVNPTTISDTTTPGASPTFLGGYINGGSIGFASMIATQIRLITGGAAWWTSPVTTLAALNSRGLLPATPVAGDIVYYNGTTWVRLAIGTTGQLLDVIAGLPSWQTITAGGVGAIPAPASPVTGDLLYYNGANWVRLPIGTLNQALLVQGGIPTWVSSPPGTLNDGMWTYYNAGSTRVDLKLRSPAVVASGGVVTEYANIQNAINAATSGQWVVIPPGTYAESITLKSGVVVSELIPGTVTISGSPGVNTIITASNSVLVVDTINSSLGASGISVDHASGVSYIRCRLLSVSYSGGSLSGISSNGAGTLDYEGDQISVTSTAASGTAYGISTLVGGATIAIRVRDLTVTGTGVSGGGAVLYQGTAGAGSVTITAQTITLSGKTCYGPQNLGATGTLTLVASVMSATSTGGNAYGVYLNSGAATFNITISSSLTVTQTGGNAYGVNVTVGTLNLRGPGTISGGTTDLVQSGGTLNLYGVQYDITKTSGTLTFLTGDRMRPGQQRLFAQVFSN